MLITMCLIINHKNISKAKPLIYYTKIRSILLFKYSLIYIIYVLKTQYFKLLNCIFFNLICDVIEYPEKYILYVTT